MGFTDLVANSKEEYVNLCTKLVNDKKFYNQMKENIKKNQSKLFQDQETLEEWRELMARDN